MTLSPRVSRFLTQLTDSELDNAVRITPVPIRLLGDDVVQQATLMELTLKSIFEPDRQIRGAIRQIVSIMRAHAESNFASDPQYLARLHAKDPWVHQSLPAYCLTGLGGVGKTALLKAIFRLLGPPRRVQVGVYGNLPLVAAWPITLRDGVGLNGLLGEHIFDQTIDEAASPLELAEVSLKAKNRSLPLLINLARRISWRDAVCLLWVDEFQFISQSSSANSLATSVLLQLQSIGPRLLYCANYSLINKLMRRHQSERQRLLSKPIILRPSEPGDQDWKNYLKVVCETVPDVLKFDPIADAKDIHLFTFGLKRLVVELIVAALPLATAKRNKRCIGIEELRSAYKSLSYTANRKDVEILNEQSIRGNEIRADLWCPFRSTDSKQNVEELTAAINNFEKRTEDAFLESAMTPQERAAAKELIGPGTTSTMNAKVYKLRGPRATKDDLLKGIASYPDLL